MALCESQLDSNLPQLREESPRSEDHESVSRESPETPESESPEKKPKLEPNGDVYQVPGGLPLTVDYRSPVSHFVPPVVELYAAKQKNEQSNSTAEPSVAPKPMKRKRGRPRVDKTSPEYLANLAARKQAREMAAMMNRNNEGTPTGEKRKRGRPRVDKTSPEYLARKRARELEALERKAKREYRRRTTGANTVVKTPTKSPTMVKNSTKTPTVAKNPTKVSTGVKNPTKMSAVVKNSTKTPTVVKTATKMPTKLTSRVAKKLPPVKKATTRSKAGGKIRKLPQNVKKVSPAVRKSADRKVIVRKNSKFIKRKDSAASSSAGDTTPRVKRKYTKRAPGAKKNDSPNAEKVKGKRGRPRKTDQMPGSNRQQQQPKIRVRSNLMPINSEPITLDSDDEPDLGSPSQASDSLSLDENLRALRHIHEKYANIDKDELYEAHLLAANFKKPSGDSQRHRDDDEVLSIRSSEGNSVKEVDTGVEKLEDSSGSDSDSSSSGSGSSSSGSSSSSSSSSGSSSSDSSDSDSDAEQAAMKNGMPPSNEEDSRSYGAWSHSGNQSDQSDSNSDAEASRERLDPDAIRAEQDAISESDNESADKSFQCHICRKWYSTRVTLKIHRRSHQARGSGASRARTRSSDRYECDCCNQTFPRREKLWEHKAEAHRGSMTVRCEVCRKCFEDDNELAAHDRTHTPDERIERASFRPSVFTERPSKMDDFAVPEPPAVSKFMCEYCFKHNHGRCSECGATFARYDQLRRHRVCAHGAPPGGAAAAAAAAGMPHACNQCGKRFTHPHSLARHMHNHAKQLYRCVVCKASFARADQLAQHLNSHLANYKRLKP